MRPIDADALEKTAIPCEIHNGASTELCVPLYQIRNAPTMPLPDFKEGYKQAILDGKTNYSRPTGEWIPVKYRPLTTEERIDFAEYYGIEYSDTVDEKAFDCHMPDDGQEILVSGQWGVSTDVADNDIIDGGYFIYGLEGNGDWEGIDAWMPLPEPYKGGKQ